MRRRLFVGVFAVGCLALVSVFGLVTTLQIVLTPASGVEVPVSEIEFELPRGVRQVSYYRGVRGSLYFECECSESAFLKWVVPQVKEAGGGLEDLQEIEGKSCCPRYCDHVIPKCDQPEACAEKGYEVYIETANDGWLTILFDRTSNRMYYERVF